jgi:hypothetical protein
MTGYEGTTSHDDICPMCLKKANRVYSEMFDPNGKNDAYVCDNCQMYWPTEWSHERISKYNQ